MKNKITRFLIVSLMLILVLCISVFSFLAVFMTQKSTETINEVDTIYMANMSRQISMHFETTIELRLAQLAAIVETVTPQPSASHDALVEKLSYMAQARGFNYLALDCGMDAHAAKPINVKEVAHLLERLLKSRA